METFIAGPWLGEFGWELMMWQARLRYLTLKSNYKNIICIIEKGHEYIYKDFATSFLYIDTNPNDIKNGWKLNEKNPIVPKTMLEYLRNKYKTMFIYNTGEQFNFRDQKFIKYHIESNNKYDLIFHCRQTTKMGTGYRNWPLKKWEEIRSIFSNLKIACIGSPSASICIDNTDNYIGMPLEKSVEILSNAKMIIGTSSGPMHLASLCGCKHIIFTGKESCFGKETNRYRYEKGWNPFQTKAIVLDQEGWNPSVQTVAKAIEQEL